MACTAGKRRTARHENCLRWTLNGDLCGCDHHTTRPDKFDARRWRDRMREIGVPADQLPALEGMKK
jgi:hypothetical protein